ncbi:MAG: hypothetical protein BWY63_03567 [Chloroflexi bacterium ADurb.Bin360]|nr:MAG: hypothetical protein BWY63_03567 [Chloroflexi bacterium ADurb.Bin360]
MGMGTIGRTNYLAARGPGGVDEPLKLHRGHDIRRGPVTVLPQLTRVEHVVANRHNNGTDLASEQLLPRHEEVYGFG